MTTNHRTHRHTPVTWAAVAIGGAALLTAAASAQAPPNIKPPQSQAWIDVATYSGMDMPIGGAAC